MSINFMQFTHEDKTRFEPFFQTPSIEALHEQLTPTEFEQFLGYVFFCAGFSTENVSLQHIPRGPGVDLNLYNPANPRRTFARIEAKRFDPNGPGVPLDVVLQFAGKLAYAGDIQGYLITTSHFHANARHVASQPGMQNVHLVDGEMLLRYITYVYGSRVNDGHGFHRTLKPVLPGWLFNDLAHMARSHTRIITVANNKGGVGKSTTALNVGFALSSLGKRVLLVDMDGQANLTSDLPPRAPDVQRQRGQRGQSQPPVRTSLLHARSITEHFTAEHVALQDLIQLTRFDNIWVLPSDEELHRIEPGGSAQPEAEIAFARELRALQLSNSQPDSTEQTSHSDFDFVVVDTPPAQSHFARIALAAADFALVPLRADSFSVLGINRAIRATKTMQALSGGPMARSLLLTQWRDVRTMREALGKLRLDTALSGYHMFDTAVPYDDHIEQAHISLINGGSKTIFGWRNGGAAQAYKKITEEIVRKVG